MELINVQIIRRGKQLGFIIPHGTVKRLGIRPGSDIEICFLRKLQQSKIGHNFMKKLFGNLKKAVASFFTPHPHLSGS